MGTMFHKKGCNHSVLLFKMRSILVHGFIKSSTIKMYMIKPQLEHSLQSMGTSIYYNVLI